MPDTLFKGQMFMQQGRVGWSDTFFSNNPGLNQAQAIASLTRVAEARRQLMCTSKLEVTTQDTGTEISFLRVSDEKVFRDGRVVEVSMPGTIDEQASSPHICPVIRGYVSPTVWRALYLTGTPAKYFHGTEFKPTNAWKTALTNYKNVLNVEQWGVRYDNVAYRVAGYRIQSATYDGTTGKWTFGVLWANPGGEFVVDIRGIKAPKGLNGVFDALSVGPGLIQIQKRLPGGVWDGSGWAHMPNYIVGAFSDLVIVKGGRKKRGRPFGLSVGRQRRAA